MFNQHPTTFGDDYNDVWNNPYWYGLEHLTAVADLFLQLPLHLAEAMILEQDGYSVEDVLAMISIEGECK